MEEQLHTILGSFSNKKNDLIPVLQKIQDEFGYLSEEAMLFVAKALKIPESSVHGVATFYAQFRFTPKGRNHIMLCRGTACHVKGAPRILEEIENQLLIKEGTTSHDLEYSIESVACIGACSLAPCITINDKVEAALTPQKIEKLFSPPKNS